MSEIKMPPLSVRSTEGGPNQPRKPGTSNLSPNHNSQYPKLATGSQLSGKVKVDLDVIQNPQLSFKARGLYTTICYLQQHKGIERPNLADLRPYSTSGQTATASAYRELKAAGVIPPYRSKPPKSHRPGHVYVLHAIDTDRYKIGLSKKYPTRISKLGKQSPYPVELVLVIQCQDMSAIEDRLHDLFDAKRVHGEWFVLDAADLACIEQLGGKGGAA